MKKRILFCLQTMICGGVEKELITILKRFDPNMYNLSILLFYSCDHEMEKKIPSHVEVMNLHVDTAYYFGSSMGMLNKRIKCGNIVEALKIALLRGTGIGTVPAIMSIDGIESFGDKYDYAVCYHMHSPIVLRYVAEKVNASKKYIWIHNDFSTTGFPVGKYGRWLDKYDAIVGVSLRLSEEFSERCPQFASKVVTLHNIVDAEEIREKSVDYSGVEPSFLNDTRTKIVTVGRFVEQKGFDLAIKTARILKENGISFAWYAIGYGKEEPKMNSLIRKYALEDSFIILGRKENPYPYMRSADLYVQPSRHEGYAITIEEAKVLRKCIICTNFAGASEQIQNGINGLIVQEFTPEKIGKTIMHLLTDKNSYSCIAEKIKSMDYDDDWKQIEEVFTQ